MPTFTEAQLVVLRALCDAAFQGHEGEDYNEILAALPADAPLRQREKVEAFISTKFSDWPGAVAALDQQFQDSLSPTNLADIQLTLTLLGTRAGTLLLTGHTSAFADLTLEQREKVLKGWSTSRLLLLRKAYRGFACLSLFVAYTAIDDVALATGYPALGDPNRAQSASRVRSHHPYVFKSISAPFEVIETDVLVIGSGAGGGVVVSQMAQKGWKTLVVEKGRYFKPEDLPGNPKEGMGSLYESSGLFATEVLNWAASLAPQGFLRKEWANSFGLPHFLSPEYTSSIEFVQKRMGVSAANIEHSAANSHFIDGGTVSWLADAAQAGCEFLIETSVERLLFASSSTSPSPTPETLHAFTPTASRKRCIGALLKSKDGTLAIVRAKEAVVVSAGSINSPAVLMRSGLKNPRIGKNLRLHPTSFVTGYYDELINPWDGSIMTAVSSARENLDGSHYGSKLEVMMSFPGGTAAAFVPWTASKEHKIALLGYNRSFTLIAICRDRGSGQIVLDKDGRARIDYRLDSYDGLSLLAGVVAGCEIHLAAGANRITTAQCGVEPYIPEPGHKFLADPKWIEWIATVEKAGIHPTWGGIGSAHQMGSNQMGSKPTTSVVDPRGRVWGTDGLYVADASVFPTSSGVNPMITVLATAHSIAQFIDEDIRVAASSPIMAHL
ncbi:hypothetical protein RQP46_009389 [Phenoliferia psychrophenolica]